MLLHYGNVRINRIFTYTSGVLLLSIATYMWYTNHSIIMILAYLTFIVSLLFIALSTTGMNYLCAILILLFSLLLVTTAIKFLPKITLAISFIIWLAYLDYDLFRRVMEGKNASKNKVNR